MSDCRVEDDFPTWINFTVDFETVSAFKKIQPKDFMNHPTAILEKSFESGLFRLAAFANDIKSVKARERVLALSQTSPDKMMFDPRILESILEGISRKGRSTRQILSTALRGIGTR